MEEGTRNRKLMIFSTIPHSRGVVQSPAVGDDCNNDKRDLDQSVLHGNGTPIRSSFAITGRAGWKSDFFTARAPLCLRMTTSAMITLTAWKECSKGVAGRPQVQGAHKEIIQSDIGDTGTAIKYMGLLLSPRPAENGADDIIGRDKRDADKTDGQIFYGSRYRSLRRGHYSYNGRTKNKKRHSKHHRQAHNSVTVFPIPEAAFFLSPAPTACPDGNRGTHGEPYDHDCEHMHYLGADGHSRCTGDAFKLADDNRSAFRKESAENKKEDRAGKKQDVFEYAAGGEIFFLI